MAKHKPLSQLVLDIGEDAAERLDQWKSSLLLLDGGSMPGISEKSFLGMELRAAAVVASMAELENLIREFLIGLTREVNASATPIMNLKQSLRALAAHSNFDSLTSTRDSEVAWEQRMRVTSLETDSAIAKFPTAVARRPQPPMDGRTPRPPLLLRLWAVLGIAGTPFPIAAAGTSLTKLALLRNDIAHRNIPITEVFSQPGTSANDIAKYVDDLQLLILHLATEWSTYSLMKSYRI